jgi:hypothetical protein
MTDDFENFQQLLLKQNARQKKKTNTTTWKPVKFDVRIQLPAVGGDNKNDIDAIILTEAGISFVFDKATGTFLGISSEEALQPLRQYRIKEINKGQLKKLLEQRTRNISREESDDRGRE